jgi:hypothetical protein
MHVNLHCWAYGLRSTKQQRCGCISGSTAANAFTSPSTAVFEAVALVVNRDRQPMSVGDMVHVLLLADAEAFNLKP